MVTGKQLPRTPHRLKDVEGFVTIGQTFVNFDNDGTIKVSNGSLKASEFAGCAMISEILRQLRLGKPFTYDFDPLTWQDTDKIVMCEWLRSGNLKLETDSEGEPLAPSRKWQHANSVAEAMARGRKFTCNLSLYQLLPKRRAASKLVLPESET